MGRLVCNHSGFFDCCLDIDMIKFIVNFQGYKKDEKHDLGCVINKLMVERGVAAWIKISDVKYTVK